MGYAANIRAVLLARPRLWMSERGSGITAGGNARLRTEPQLYPAVMERQNHRSFRGTLH
jgi:hypothetical protein